MTRSGRPPGAGDSDSARDGYDESTGTPRWVIVSGIIVLVLIVAVAVLHLAGGGFVGHVPPGGTP